MTPADLEAYRDATVARFSSTQEIVDELAAAPPDRESADRRADALAEGIFVREFSAYENDLESLFLHYVTGGCSLNGLRANSYLNIGDEERARKLTRAGAKFLSWANPERIRGTASLYIKNGWPICDIMNAESQHLGDCERIRNRIAHKSTESLVQFNIVQRNVLGTERLFSITPGQLLRIRSIKFRRLHMGHYLDVMNGTLQAIIEPPS